MEVEVQGYLTELNLLRGQIREGLAGLDDSAANWHPVAKDTNSIYAVMAHLTGAQANWIKQVIAGIPIKRDRNSEFKEAGHLPDIVKRWEESNKESDEILSRLTANQLRETRHPAGPYGEVSVQWCILHNLSHMATHLGHIQLTRQLWEQKQAA